MLRVMMSVLLACTSCRSTAISSSVTGRHVPLASAGAGAVACARALNPASKKPPTIKAIFPLIALSPFRRYLRCCQRLAQSTHRPPRLSHLDDPLSTGQSDRWVAPSVSLAQQKGSKAMALGASSHRCTLARRTRTARAKPRRQYLASRPFLREANMASVLITGTSRGIGLETALAFGRAGHRVHATMRNPSQSPALAETAAREKLPITVSTMDVDSDQSVTMPSRQFRKMDPSTSSSTMPVSKV